MTRDWTPTSQPTSEKVSDIVSDVEAAYTWDAAGYHPVKFFDIEASQRVSYQAGIRDERRRAARERDVQVEAHKRAIVEEANAKAAGFEEGRQEERRAVVAWLRESARGIRETVHWGDAADRIERGDHLKPSPEERRAKAEERAKRRIEEGAQLNGREAQLVWQSLPEAARDAAVEAEMVRRSEP